MDGWTMGRQGRVCPLMDDGSGSSMPSSFCILLPPDPTPNLPIPCPWDPSQFLPSGQMSSESLYPMQRCPGTTFHGFWT